MFGETLSISMEVVVKDWICLNMLRNCLASTVLWKHALELELGDCWEGREEPFRLRSPANGIGHHVRPQELGCSRHERKANIRRWGLVFVFLHEKIRA